MTCPHSILDSLDLGDNPDDARGLGYDQCETLVWVRQKVLLIPQSSSTKRKEKTVPFKSQFDEKSSNLPGRAAQGIPVRQYTAAA